MERISFGVSFTLAILVISTICFGRHGTDGQADTQGKAREQVPAVESSLLRAKLLACADKLGVLDPSKDYTNFMKDKKGNPYALFMHEMGTFFVPLDPKKLENGTYQAFVSFPTEPKHPKVLLTIAINPKDANDVKIYSTIPKVEGQNPQKLDELNALSSVTQGEDPKNSKSETHFLDSRFALSIKADVQERSREVATSVPELPNIFADLTFATDLKNAATRSLASMKSDAKDAEKAEAVKKAYAGVYNRFEKGDRWTKATEIALKELGGDLKGMEEALKVCAEVPAESVSNTAKTFTGPVADARKAHDTVAAKLPGAIAPKLKEFNAKLVPTLTGEDLKAIHDSVEKAIQQAYAQARGAEQAGQKK